MFDISSKKYDKLSFFDTTSSSVTLKICDSTYKRDNNDSLLSISFIKNKKGSTIKLNNINLDFKYFFIKILL